MKSRQIEHFELRLSTFDGLPASKRFLWLKGVHDGLHLVGSLDQALLNRVIAEKDKAFYEALFEAKKDLK